MVSAGSVDDKLKRIGHSWSAFKVERLQERIAPMLSMTLELKVRNVDDKLKRIGHSLIAFNVGRFRCC